MRKSLTIQVVTPRINTNPVLCINNGQAMHGARKHAWRTQAAWANNNDDGKLSCPDWYYSSGVTTCSEAFTHFKDI